MKEFCDRYPGTTCIRLHHTEHDGRHHGIDIDVGAIVDEAAFRQRLALELADWCGEIDAILAPNTRSPAGCRSRRRGVRGCPAAK